MKETSRRRAKGAAAVVVAIAVAAGGVAVANWLSYSQGSASAQAAKAEPLVITTNASVDAALYPGKTNAPLSFKVKNPNPYPIVVTDVAQGSGNVTATGGLPGRACETTGVSIDPVRKGTEVLAANQTTTLTYNIAKMSNASDHGCQGATFNVPVAIYGSSAG